MGGTSIWHWLIVGIIVLLLFGRGKISEMMGDVAKGIKAFKKGMTEEETTTASTQPDTNDPVKTLQHQGTHPATATPAGTSERKIG